MTAAGSGSASPPPNVPASGGSSPAFDPATPGATATDRIARRTQAKAERLIGKAAAAPDADPVQAAADRRAASSEWNRNAAGRDVVGRDKKKIKKYNITYRGAGQTKIRTRRVAADELEPALFGFAESEWSEELAVTVAEYPVTVVRGSRGSGRRTMSLRALTRLEPPEIYELDSNSDLSTVSVVELPKRCAMILDRSSGAKQKWPTFELDRIAAELEQNGSRLVVVTHGGVRLPEYGPQVALVEIRESPPPELVLSRHLEVRLRGRPDDVAGLLASPELERLLANLGTRPSMQDLAWLASDLADCADGVESLVATIEPLMTARQAEMYAEWFDGLPDLRLRCLALSLAVLGGEQTHEIVSAVAFDLMSVIDPKAERPRGGRRSPFTMSTAIELDVLDAILQPGIQKTNHGDLPVSQLSYARRDFGPRLFMHVWQEYPGIRRPLTRWLDKLARHQVQQVRIRAATAVARLARESFEHVYAGVLMRWADSKEVLAQEAAATAMVFVGQDAALHPLVTSLLVGWERTDRTTMRSAAARTYGISTRLQSPTEALQRLARMARADDVNVRWAIGLALCDLLLENPGTGLAGQVLVLLHSWGQDREHHLDGAARLAFLILGNRLSISSDNDVSPGWPTLLHVSAFGTEAHGRIAWLWWFTLNSADFGTSARDVLTRWAELAEPIPEASAQMRRLLAKVAADKRTTDLLKWTALSWTGLDGIAPQLGEWVRTELAS